MLCLSGWAYYFVAVVLMSITALFFNQVGVPVFQGKLNSLSPQIYALPCVNLKSALSVEAVGEYTRKTGNAPVWSKKVHTCQEGGLES